MWNPFRRKGPGKGRAQGASSAQEGLSPLAGATIPSGVDPEPNPPHASHLVAFQGPLRAREPGAILLELARLDELAHAGATDSLRKKYLAKIQALRWVLFQDD